MATEISCILDLSNPTEAAMDAYIEEHFDELVDEVANCYLSNDGLAEAPRASKLIELARAAGAQEEVEIAVMTLVTGNAMLRYRQMRDAQKV